MARAHSILDTTDARIAAFTVAVLLAVMAVLVWQDDVAALFSDQSVFDAPAPAGADVNPAYEACLEQRVGDVDRMLADGVIGQDQHAAFRTRAVELCAGQTG